jgi:signal transduction histidine kinase
VEKKSVHLFLIISLASVILQAAVIWSLDFINTRGSSYADITDGNVDAAEIPHNKPLILSLPAGADSSYSFSITSDRRQALSLLFEDAHAPYRLFIQGTLAGQNTFPKEQAYRPEIGYSVFPVMGPEYLYTQDEVDGEPAMTGSLGSLITLERKTPPFKPSSQALFYLGTSETIDKLVQVRSMYVSALCICFVLILLASSIVYLKYRTDYMFFTLLISLVSVLKSLIVGDMPFPGGFAGITPENMFYWDSITGIVNFLLSQLLCFRLFQFRMKKSHLYLYISVFLIAETAYIVFHYLPLMVGMHGIGVLLILYTGAYAYKRGVPQSVLLLFTYSIFSATVVYRFLITFIWFPRGYVSEIVFSPQLGNLLYLAAFLFSVIMIYSHRLKDLEKQQKLLERITLFRGINHDLKLPLSVIKLNAQMLKAYETTAREKDEISSTILEATTELEGLSSNINGFLMAEKPPELHSSTAIYEHLEQLARHYSHRAEQEQIDFTLILPPQDAVVAIDFHHFDRMMQNLVDNAFKYTASPGFIRVGCTIGKVVRIVIEDSGIGMTRDEVANACEPLYRAESSRNTEGSGLGLSVVQSIVDGIQGSLKIQSTPGKGTTIIIVLPVAGQKAR